MSHLLVCLLICLSVHACNARYIGFNPKQDSTKGLMPDIHRENLYETSVSSEMTPSIPEEFQAQRVEVGKIDRRRIHENALGATTNPKINVEVLFKEEEGTKKAPSGAGHKLTVSSQSNLQWTTKGLNWQEPSDNNVAVELSENDMVGEDVVVMDYAQPHRKPPIHNEKP